jgi:rSAM/selenodomain-associated transferase 1
VLGVFAKIPDREPVKTRLQPRVSALDAARFQMASLVDGLETAARVVESPTLFLSHGADNRDRIGALLMAHGLAADVWNRIRIAPQHGPDLGARMTHAFADLWSMDRAPALLVGSDSPSVDTAMLRRAVDALDSADVVLGPAADGGYWCVGLRAPAPSLFHGVPWSRHDTLAATRARAATLGLSVVLLESWSDVDRPEDLDLLARQVAMRRSAGDAGTARHVETWLRSTGFLRDDPAPREVHG